MAVAVVGRPVRGTDPLQTSTSTSRRPARSLRCVSKAFVSTQAPRRERALRAHTRPQHCRLQAVEQRRLFSWV